MREHVAIMLRDWSDGDAEWYVQQVRDPEIRRFTTERPTLTSEEFCKALGDLRRNDDALGFVVTDPASSARLANVAATRHGQLAEVSYWVASVARGKGVASRALRALCERVASSWDVTEIRLWTHAENVASQRVAEHAGFSHVPSDDGTREVGGQCWPIRWYSRSMPAAPCPSGGPG